MARANIADANTVQFEYYHNGKYRIGFFNKSTGHFTSVSPSSDGGYTMHTFFRPAGNAEVYVSNLSGSTYIEVTVWNTPGR